MYKQNFDDKLRDEFQAFMKTDKFASMLKESRTIAPRQSRGHRLSWICIAWIHYYCPEFNKWYDECAPSTRLSRKAFNKHFRMPDCLL